MKKFGLSKNERIKSRKLFQILYSKGRTIYSKNGLFKAVFYFTDYENPTPNVKVAFVVFKKAGNAVWRNRIKRLMREVYRFNKSLFSDMKEDKLLLISFSPNKVNKKNFNKIKLRDVEPEILSLMKKIKKIAGNPDFRKNNVKNNNLE